MAANKMDEILKHFPDLEDGWKEMEEKLKAEPSEREMLSLKYRKMLQRESSKESLPEPEFTKAQRAESDSKVMKANEAPERLYLSKNIYSTYLYQVPDPDDDTAVEYTRTDAFIEKACLWLSNVSIEDMAYKYNDFDTSEDWYKFIEDFRKYMSL